MNDDFFDQFDPCTDSNDKQLLAQSRQNWKDLAAARKRRLQWRRRGVASASVVLAITCVLYARSRSATKGPIQIANEMVPGPTIPSTSTTTKTIQDAPPKPVTESSHDTKPDVLTLADFQQELKRAGIDGSPQWKQVVADLVASPRKVQQRAVDLVKTIPTADAKYRAMCLIGDAAGVDEHGLLLKWLEAPKTRGAAWKRSLAISTSADWQTLGNIARSSQEKHMLCEKLWISFDSIATDALVNLAKLPQWRLAVRRSSRPVSAEGTLPLILRLRQHDVTTRTATAFVLSSIPGQQLDRTLADMVVRGRYRQPCYLTLMSRDSQTAKKFLAHAAQRRDLAPALASATSHFNAMAAQLTHWKELSEGHPHEDSPKRSDVLSIIPAERLARIDDSGTFNGYQHNG